MSPNIDQMMHWNDCNGWIWVDLTPDEKLHAEELAIAWPEHAKKVGAKPDRHVATPDKRHQNRTGAYGEVGYRVIRRLPLPPVSEMIGTWKKPDAEGNQIKTTSYVNGDLIFSDADLGHPDLIGFALMYSQTVQSRSGKNPTGRVALVGMLLVDEVLKLRRWGKELPTPNWLVEQKYVEPWHV